MVPLPVRLRIDPLAMKLRVDRVGSGRADGMHLPPPRDELV